MRWPRVANMRVSYFGYNAFILEESDRKLVFDPGADLRFLLMKSLVPRNEWNGVTHVFVTHADPDHYWYADRVANYSGAPIICNRTMVRERACKRFLIAPRRGGLSFTTPIGHVQLLAPGETLKLEELRITGIRTVHGPLPIRIGPIKKTLTPGPDQRIGWGSIGFEIRTGAMVIVVLGDALLETIAWKEIRKPDLLIVPIGGSAVPNTMNEHEALEAVKAMQPVVAIPCHYDCPGFFAAKTNPADVVMFKKECERMGSRCIVMKRNESIEI